MYVKEKNAYTPIRLVRGVPGMRPPPPQGGLRGGARGPDVDDLIDGWTLTRHAAEIGEGAEGPGLGGRDEDGAICVDVVAGVFGWLGRDVAVTVPVPGPPLYDVGTCLCVAEAGQLGDACLVREHDFVGTQGAVDDVAGVEIGEAICDTPGGGLLAEVMERFGHVLVDNMRGQSSGA